MSDEIHATAAAGWSGQGAEDYERGRPSYPPAAVQRIGAELDLGPGRRVLDLAAGTGKLTRELVALGAEVLAVEPVAAMRAHLARAVPSVQVLDGTAERIPLVDGSVHGVCVAQAFHWFDVPRAAAEIARVLDPTGGLAIVRNEWGEDQSAGWAADLEQFLHGQVEPPSTHRRSWMDELVATGHFAAFQHAVIPNDQDIDVEALRLRVASISYIAALPAAQRADLLDDVSTLLAGHGLTAGQPITVPTVTHVWWARRAA